MSKNENAAPESNEYPIEISGWYRVIRGLIRFLLRILSRVEVEGLEHLPEQGPYLMITNHIHWLDPPLIMVVYPYRGHVFAAEKWEHHWFLGPVMKSLDAIFVNRGAVDRKALRRALAVLQGGGVLGLAPEGTRSKTMSMQRGRSGAAYMAYRTGVPVVPVVTWGQEEVFPTLRRLRRATCHVVFGPPFYAPPVEGKASAAEVHGFAEEMMYRMAALLPAEYRGLYDDVADREAELVMQPEIASRP
jgi:1-acyl-sn-glycerol-3-phosphate acyltransferase